MGKFNTRGLEQLTLSMEQLAQIPDETQFSMLESGAAVLIERWKEKLQAMKRTGQLIKSIKAARRKTDTPIVSVTPKGTRKNAFTGKRFKRDGSPSGTYQGTNAEVAYILEYGTPRMAATHWMETANEEASAAVVAAEAAVWDEYLKSLNL